MSIKSQIDALKTPLLGINEHIVPDEKPWSFADIIMEIKADAAAMLDNPRILGSYDGKDTFVDRRALAAEIKGAMPKGRKKA